MFARAARIIELDRFHVPRRLQRTCRGERFEVSIDRDFSGVIRGSATASGRRGGTWLIPPMIRAYSRLFELGHAHSVEVWREGQLVGGTYGLAIAGLFAAESMFHIVRDASKVALVRLVSHLRQRGYALMDIQQLTPHTSQFGAIEIPPASISCGWPRHCSSRPISAFRRADNSVAVN